MYKFVNDKSRPKQNAKVYSAIIANIIFVMLFFYEFEYFIVCSWPVCRKGRSANNTCMWYLFMK